MSCFIYVSAAALEKTELVCILKFNSIRMHNVAVQHSFLCSFAYASNRSMTTASKHRVTLEGVKSLKWCFRGLQIVLATPSSHGRTGRLLNIDVNVYVIKAL